MTMVTRGLTILIALCTPILARPRNVGAQDVPARAGEDVEAAVRAVHARMLQDAARLDAEALYAHVLDTDTPPIVENGRLELTRAAALQSTVRGLQGIERLEYTYARDHVTVLSPTSALWVASGTAAATLSDGREITAPFAESILFVERDGEWRVLHAHRSVPQP
jgi:hypothetical protein